MTTALEIVDSAVKIGLGGLISGIATYIVTRRNNKHELTKMVRDDRKQLVREVSTKLEEGTALLNRAIHGYSTTDSGESFDSTMLVEAHNTINQAKALSGLSGADDLFKEVTKYSDLLCEFYILLRDTNGESRSDKEKEIVVEMNKVWETLHPLLSKAYDSALRTA